MDKYDNIIHLEDKETSTLTVLGASHEARFATVAGGLGCLGRGWGGGSGRSGGWCRGWCRSGGRSGSGGRSRALGRRCRGRRGVGGRGCGRGGRCRGRRGRGCDVEGGRGSGGRGCRCGGVGGAGDAALVKGAFALWEMDSRRRVYTDVDGGAGDGVVGMVVNVA